jgi:hypothetical protein
MSRSSSLPTAANGGKFPCPQSERLLYPRKEVGFQLGGLSLRAVDYLLASGAIRSQRIGARVVVHHKELERFARSNHYGTVTGKKATAVADADPNN